MQRSTVAATGKADAKKRHDKLRLTCLMELLYATGMRVTELVSLPAEAVRGDPQMILVRGKGGKERMVPLSPRPPARRHNFGLLCVIADPQAEKSAFLFPSRGKLGHLTRIWFFQQIKKLAICCGY